MPLVSRTLTLLPKLGRLIVFGAVVYVLALAFSVRQAQAEVEEILFGLGAEMMQMPGSDESRLRQLTLNGATIQMRTGNIDAPMADVLRHFEGRCESRDGQFEEQLLALSDDFPELRDEDTSEVDATIVEQTESRGFVACLDMGEGTHDANDIAARMQRFVTTMNISDVGHMRYVYATKVSETQTFYVSIFSDDDLNLLELFPTEGDVPGEDPVQRPDGSRRILSSSETGRPYGVTIFAGGGAQTAVVEEYERNMRSDGYELVTVHEGERVRVDGTAVLAFAKDEEIITVMVSESNGQTMSTVLTTDADDQTP
ncbi:MAG: hypothetical protein AAF645_01425 [Myxococcota bacterium]